VFWPGHVRSFAQQAPQPKGGTETAHTAGPCVILRTAQRHNIMSYLDEIRGMVTVRTGDIQGHGVKHTMQGPLPPSHHPYLTYPPITPTSGLASWL
jgi:hypothetical protein